MNVDTDPLDLLVSVDVLTQAQVYKMYADHSCVAIFGGGKLKPTYCGKCNAHFVYDDCGDGVVMVIGFTPYRNPLGLWQFS